MLSRRQFLVRSVVETPAAPRGAATRLIRGGRAHSVKARLEHLRPHERFWYQKSIKGVNGPS